MAVMTVSEARAALPEVLNRVADGEEITITRHGRAVAVIVRPDVMWRRSRAEEALGEADRLRDLLEAAADTELTVPGGVSEQYAEELIAAIRADRDARASGRLRRGRPDLRRDSRSSAGPPGRGALSGAAGRQVWRASRYRIGAAPAGGARQAPQGWRTGGTEDAQRFPGQAGPMPCRPRHGPASRPCSAPATACARPTPFIWRRP